MANLGICLCTLIDMVKDPRVITAKGKVDVIALSLKFTYAMDHRNASCYSMLKIGHNCV